MDHVGLMASVVLEEPSLGLSPVLVTEIFRCPMSALGHRPTIGFGPHLDGSTSDSGQGNRAGLTPPPGGAGRGRRHGLLLANQGRPWSGVPGTPMAGLPGYRAAQGRPAPLVARRSPGLGPRAAGPSSGALPPTRWPSGTGPQEQHPDG
jgi:hypothetical protein